MRQISSFVLALGLAALVGCGDSGTTSTGSTTTGSGGGGTGGDGGGTPTGKPLKIANWNVHNLLNDKDDSPAPDETIETTAKYQAHIQAIAAVLGDMDPDVAVLAEVENQSTLDDLNAALGNRYVEARLIDANDPRGVDIAALSKLPFSSVVSHATDEFAVEGTAAPTYQFARDAVEYHFTFEGQEIALVGVHLRSKGPPDDPNKRLAEAERARAIANDLTTANPDLAVAILGDFNDLPDSAPWKAVAGSASDLYSDAPGNIADPDRWTFDFMGAQELIDHQMGNAKLTSRLDKSSVIIRHSADVGVASDHAPMMATYLF